MRHKCQVLGCETLASYHSFPENAVHPDEGGMQTCDAHLSDGMSHIEGQPAPKHWLVFPIAFPSGTIEDLDSPRTGR